MTPLGFALSQNPSGKPGVCDSGGAESGAVGGDSPGTTSIGQARIADPDLAAVVAAWTNLPPAIKAGILAMVGASGGGVK
jgi:hypothetical protein